MPDIFISYSRSEQVQALELAERLQTLGRSVWIDRSGIDGGTLWTSEIVEGIHTCRTFLLLVSPASVNSHNCAKELHLAVEKSKHILPVVLGATELPPSFEYPLAGLQRVPIGDMAGIVRALERVESHSTLRKDLDLSVEHAQEKIKRLAVLPFEDRSVTHDNEWFADGLSDELATILNKLEQVFVTDKQTTREYKCSSLTAKQIAHELAVRYILHGAVTKAGAKIRVSADLIDTQTGNTLWDERFDGTMDDIFKIQESIARQIADGLKIHLTPGEQEGIARMPTRNAEAYELQLRAREYFARHTKQDFEYALNLLTEATILDPEYANAYLNIGNLHMVLYMLYDRQPAHLEKAEELIRRSLSLDANSVTAYLTLARLLVMTKRSEEAHRVAKQAEARLTDRAQEYLHMAQYYHFIGDHRATANMIERSLALDPDPGMTTYFNLLTAYADQGDAEGMRRAAERALPRFRKYLRSHPDDSTQRTHFTWVLEFSGNITEAFEDAESILASGMADSRNLYNLACLFMRHGYYDRGLDILEQAVAKGFATKELFHLVLFDRVRNDPRFITLLERLEKNTET